LSGSKEAAIVPATSDAQSQLAGTLPCPRGTWETAMVEKRYCLYCGRGGSLTREHIVPEALGGTLWRKSICGKCNNEFLSDLDKELTSRSPMILVAAQELHKTAGYSWDIDYSENNLLIEAQLDASARAPTVWPQMIFEEKGWQVRGDGAELDRFGIDNFGAVFVQHLVRAFRTLKTSKRPRFIFERIPRKISTMYRYPPRVFATRRIWDFDNRMHFVCRYLRADEKRRVLRRLEDLDPQTRLALGDYRLGSSRPAFHLHYEMGAVLRSLIKIAINLLYYVCARTEVDRNHFAWAIRMVTGEQRVSSRAFAENGFVYANDLVTLGCPKNHHSFRLQHDRGLWRVWLAFFSGRIGAYVCFPGRSSETWRTVDVEVPVGDRNWRVRTSPILQPLTARVEWKDLQKVIPSLPMENTRAEVTVTTREAATRQRGRERL